MCRISLEVVAKLKASEDGESKWVFVKGFLEGYGETATQMHQAKAADAAGGKDGMRPRPETHE